MYSPEGLSEELQDLGCGGLRGLWTVLQLDDRILECVSVCAEEERVILLLRILFSILLLLRF